jgi:hypothetical protein
VAGEARAAAGASIRKAVASIDLGDVEAVVIASPHGRATGVYASPAGDLDAFGPKGIGVSPPADPALAGQLAEAWGRPLLLEAADHGVVVPLRLLPALDAPVVAVAFEEGAGPDGARALAATLSGRRIAFVASANLSAGLDERSPLPSLPGARAADKAVVAALREDPRALAANGDVLERAGSCAAAPLAAFGVLFAKRSCDVLAYGHPFGVGHAVAVTR